MDLHWTSAALSDLVRLHAFLASVDPDGAARIVQGLVAATSRLLEHPRLGERLDAFEPREVRRLLIGHYEMRYEVRERTLFILRLWHTREER